MSDGAKLFCWRRPGADDTAEDDLPEGEDFHSKFRYELRCLNRALGMLPFQIVKIGITDGAVGVEIIGDLKYLSPERNASGFSILEPNNFNNLTHCIGEFSTFETRRAQKEFETMAGYQFVYIFEDGEYTFYLLPNQQR